MFLFPQLFLAAIFLPFIFSLREHSEHYKSGPILRDAIAMRRALKLLYFIYLYRGEGRGGEAGRQRAEGEKDDGTAARKNAGEFAGAGKWPPPTNE